jgi:formylglycine-generating enzyme required for sulfatase activity
MKMILIIITLLIFSVSCNNKGTNPSTDEEYKAMMKKIPAGQNTPHLHYINYKSFFIDSTEITQQLYEQIMGENPSVFYGKQIVSGDTVDYGIDLNRPVENVRFWDAITFCNKRSKMAGLDTCYIKDSSGYYCNYNKNGFRLPTNWEWIHAYQAGTLTDFYWGRNFLDSATGEYYPQNEIERKEVKKYAVSQHDFHPDSLEEALRNHIPSRAASRLPNNWGLYDMAGNVREFVHPLSSRDTSANGDNITYLWWEPYALHKGGSFIGSTWDMTYDNEEDGPKSTTISSRIGFRCVLANEE